MSKKTDTFPVDFAKIEKLEKDIKLQLNERAILVKKGASPASLDYLLISMTDSLRYEMSKMDKLAYTYEHDYE